jgi:hypothetical protein
MILLPNQRRSSDDHSWSSISSSQASYSGSSTPVTPESDSAYGFPSCRNVLKKPEQITVAARRRLSMRNMKSILDDCEQEYICSRSRVIFLRKNFFSIFSFQLLRMVKSRDLRSKLRSLVKSIYRKKIFRQKTQKYDFVAHPVLFHEF